MREKLAGLGDYIQAAIYPRHPLRYCLHDQSAPRLKA